MSTAEEMEAGRKRNEYFVKLQSGEGSLPCGKYRRTTEPVRVSERTSLSSTVPVETGITAAVTTQASVVTATGTSPNAGNASSH
jgi:hypothetical protein